MEELALSYLPSYDWSLAEQVGNWWSLVSLHWWWWLWWWCFVCFQPVVGQDGSLTRLNRGLFVWQYPRWWCWWFRTGFLCSIGRSRTWWGSSLFSLSSSSCLALPSSSSSPSPSPTKVGALPCRYNVLSCNVLSEGLPAYPKSVHNHFHYHHPVRYY